MQQNFESSTDKEWADRVAYTYTKLQNDIPDLILNTSPLAMGSQGIILERSDEDTLIKIFLRNKDAVETETTEEEKSFLNETEILEHLGGQVYGTAYTPKILEIISLPNSTEAHGAYRMPKLKGDHLQWKPFAETADPHQVETHFRSVGAVLAHFHKETEEFLLNRQPGKQNLEYGTSIESISILAPQINQALTSCNTHLQKHMESGVNHGDFNPANFLINEQKEITGLLDLSFAGYRPNYLTDFAMIPSDKVGIAIDEYEKITGKEIDPKMMLLTQLSLYTAVINHNLDNNYNESSEVINQLIPKVIGHLNQLSEITGIKFDNTEKPLGIRGYQ